MLTDCALRQSRWLLPALLAVLCLGQVWAGTRTFTIVERLGRTWTNETVTYPMTFANGECLDGSVRLTGPGGAQAVQLFDMTYWSGTNYVKTATLAFIVASLTAQATVNYTATWGATIPPEPLPSADLQYVTTADYLQATTTDFGARLRLGSATYDPPATASTVPGPIVGLRNAAGTWFGGSTLYGDSTVTSFSTQILEQGPVMARVQYTVHYANNGVLQLILRVDAYDSRVLIDSTMDGDDTACGWDLQLTPNLPTSAIQFMPEQVTLQPGTTLVNGWRNKPLANYDPGLIMNLIPWGDWWDEFMAPSFYIVYTPATSPARELVVKRLKPELWVEPNAIGTMDPWANWQRKQIPFMKGSDGSYYLRNNNAQGRRIWMLGETLTSLRPAPASSNNAMDTEPVGSLDDVKDLILDWTASAESSPRLYLSQAELADAGTRFPTQYNDLRSVSSARSDLATLGYYDTMRRPSATVCRYDAVVDSGLITAQDRALFRAQMAFIAYRLASAANWSSERGYRSGNENMTVTQTLNLGLAACALRDHPMAPTWIAYARERFEQWMDRLDDHGYWNESGHYARVSVAKFLWFAVAMKKAGYHDYFTDPRVQKMCMYYEESLTPKDSLVAAKRLSPGYGRGSHSSNWGLSGITSRATADVAPDLSRVLAWSYERTGYGTFMGDNMCNYETLYPLRTLPTQAPAWTSTYFPSLGTLFRGGIDTTQENYLLLCTQYPTNPDGEFWQSEIGGVIHWFANGKPLSRRFASVPDMNHDHGLLVSRVMLATNYQPGASVYWGYETDTTQDGLAFLPRLDYVNAGFQWTAPYTRFTTMPSGAPAFPTVAQEGQTPAHWQRQLLSIRGDGLSDAQYLVFRDTLTGGQPTQWQFWTLSSRIDEVGAPAQGSGARTLSGDRFTAIGQFGTDVEYYVASPSNTPRNTLSYTEASASHGYNVPNFAITQDLMHLQLTGDGHYFVALFPRDHTAAAPTFTTLGGGTVIKIAGDFGTDYAFLSDTAATVTAEQAAFTGTAGSVQDRTGSFALALGAAGSVTYQTTRGLTAPMPCTLRYAADRLTLTLQTGNSGGRVDILTPGTWRLEPGQTGVGLLRRDGVHRVTVPAGVTVVTLVPHDGTNYAPTAVDNAYSVAHDTTLTVATRGVLENDIDIDGDELTAIQVTGPAHGILHLNADGSFTYTPAQSYLGTDTFTYQARDAQVTSNTVTVTITVLSGGLEADTAPRPTGGSNTLTTSDWVQVGRFVAGLDAVLLGSEFQHADCAPKASKGDGVLSISDWVQSGRYVVGLDPQTPAAGPTGP